MVQGVAEERGALPLLAFAMARLWESRDKDQGLLTREAYDEIGGVAGALAQHAESTIERIGSDKLSIVREIFRNLVTAEGTRAVRDRDELLSVFDDPESAEQVLTALIGARLLTSYEWTTGDDDDEDHHHRIEIVHESLLTAWPRLVRWQTQDADGAQLRDQLRQAVQIWEERGRPKDLLWRGASFREFLVWKERYPGGLSDSETAFERAMQEQEGRKQNQRRLAVLSVISLLLLVVVVVSWLGRQARLNAREARAEARRSEAARLRVMGATDEVATRQLAYVIASLELTDDPETRKLAMRALWSGPVAHYLDVPPSPAQPQFSTDGRWLAVSDVSSLRVISQDGQSSKSLECELGGIALAFSPTSDRLAGCVGPAHVWSIPEGELLRVLDSERAVHGYLPDGRLVTFRFDVPDRSAARSLVYSTWEQDLTAPVELARLDRPTGGLYSLKLNHTFTRAVYEKEGDVFTATVDGGRARNPLRLEANKGSSLGVLIDRAGEKVASVGGEGQVTVWSLIGPTPERIRTSPRRTVSLQARAWGAFDPTGQRLAFAEGIFDLDAPPDSKPIPIGVDISGYASVGFHPDGDWLAIGNALGRPGVFALAHDYPRVLACDAFLAGGFAFSPDGLKLAVSSYAGPLTLWPLGPSTSVTRRTLLDFETDRRIVDIAFDPRGQFIVAPAGANRAWIVPLDGDEPWELPWTGRRLTDVAVAWRSAVDSDGQRVAISYDTNSQDYGWGIVHVHDLDTGGVWVLDGGGERQVSDLEFTPDGRLLTARNGELLIWDVEKAEYEMLIDGKGSFAISRFDLGPDGRVLAGAHDSVATILDIETGETRRLGSHGRGVLMTAIDPTGTIVATGSADGVVRVGPISGETPHMLVGQSTLHPWSPISFDPSGKWIAVGYEDGTVYLWPVPDLDLVPLNTLSHEELIARLKTLTNLRVVPDADSATGYRFDLDPFPGWETIPTW
jgi:WD40 repeat protein